MTGFSNTSRHMMERQARIIREMGPQQRLDTLRSLCRFVIDLAESGIRRRKPEWTPAQVRSEAARSWLTADDHARWSASPTISAE
jgi:hypothetical protein